MIDSINFIVYGISKIDFQRLINLKIVYRQFEYRKNDFGNYYRKYGSATKLNDPSLVSTGIEFEYNNILFQYYESFKCIVIIANAHKVLQKTDILLSDRDLYIDLVKKAVAETLGVNFSILNLHRIDFCVDLELDYKKMYEYLHLLDKHKITYEHIKRINEYETSVYLTSKNGQKRINIYDKYECEKHKYYERYEEEKARNGINLAEYEKAHPPYYNYYKNIFRIEVQNTKKLIAKESTSVIDKYENSVTKEIKQLFKEKEKRERLIARKSRINKEKTRMAKQSIYESINVNCPDNLKNVNINSLEIEILTIDSILEDMFENGESKEYQPNVEILIKDNSDKLLLYKDLGAYWNKESMQKYYFEFLSNFLYKGDYYKLSIAKKKIEETKDCTNCQKKHLKEFINLVNKYGINGVISNKKENEHPVWCGATVQRYIKKLQDLGINIFKISVDKEYNIKEEIRKIKKSANTENWQEKLILFIKTIQKYDIESVIATNNNQIVRNVSNCKHKQYSPRTIKTYIEMLENIGINPITIDNDSEFDSLESLYTLAKNTAKRKYFDIDNLDIPTPVAPSTPAPVKNQTRRNNIF